MKKSLELLKGKVLSFGKEEFVHPPYTPMETFGLLLSGSLQAMCDDMDGRRMILNSVRPGDTFGESLCFLRCGESPVYVRSSGPSSVLMLDPCELFLPFADEFRTGLQRRFTALLAGRTLSMNSRIQVLSKIKLRDKLIAYFSEMLTVSGSDTFTLPMNRESLAAYIGTDRSALSRELSAMKKEGIIDYSGNRVTIIRKSQGDI